jgi:hypothetical protein
VLVDNNGHVCKKVNIEEKLPLPPPSADTDTDENAARIVSKLPKESKNHFSGDQSRFFLCLFNFTTAAHWFF